LQYVLNETVIAVTDNVTGKIVDVNLFTGNITVQWLDGGGLSLTYPADSERIRKRYPWEATQ
jgi:uncharacterized protein YjdB